ncbi:unnamed protein product [Symbiodinium sp. CCMP2592]|nr:unnamed protein product [Symbiodinium sp. CCMP2592]
MAGNDVLAELGLDSDLSDDSGTSDSLDVEALLPPSGPTSPENKTGVPTFAESQEQTAAVPAAVEPDLALLESSLASSSSLDGESNLDVEALLETSSPEPRAAEQRLEETAPIAVGERPGSSSSPQEEYQSVPFAPRGSGFLDQDPAPAREEALPDASAHREIQVSEVETQPTLHSAMPVEKGSAVVGEATAAPSVEEPIRAARDGSPARGSVAQEIHRLEQVIRSRSTSPAQMVVHQPRLPSVQTQACTPDASPTRRSQARTPDASPTRRAQEERAVPEDRKVPEQPPDSAQERLTRIEKANAEAEDLWQEQLSVEISCEVARNLGSLKAQPEIFMAQVAELRLRSNLHKAASERYAELLATARAAASSPVSPAKPADLEDLEESLSKAQRCPEALRQMASDLRTRCREKEAILRVKLDHDTRQLRSQIFASIAARAKAEARLAQARAASKSAEAQQFRRAAEASLEMRRHLQDGIEIFEPVLYFPTQMSLALLSGETLHVQAGYDKAIWEIVKPKVVHHLGLDEDAVINAVDRDTGNKLDGSELCRKYPNLTVIVLVDGNPDDDLSGFHDSGREDPELESEQDD